MLGPAEIRALAERLGVRPTKTLGQNFLHDPNTIRRIVRTAGIGPDDVVLEVGPGLGSLTLGLLGAAAGVVAVEIDPVLAAALPDTVADRLPSRSARLAVLTADAMTVSLAELTDAAQRVRAPHPAAVAADVAALPTVSTDASAPAAVSADASAEPRGAATAPAAAGHAGGGTPATAGPTALVANLPYNVAVPVVLHLLETVPTLRTGLVMVQAEVADRLAAPPGSRTYGVPSAKAAWYSAVTKAGAVPRAVFWPVPNVDSGLVRLERRDPPVGASRKDTFAVVDAAFAQRRKTLRAALAGWAGGAPQAEAALRTAGVDPSARGETVDITTFARIAAAQNQRGR
ncbi:ribosomal RNA small subunit methyltransferase A [Cryptosporangium aurantiacum]|uniref:Ribosomal RNA small subunit methyltransferase A n=1 Tax=Cryptosporangium aurantiacum TaxID=134849 RepID=A0A1M7RJ74_9ACTN|nr:16S rRNA (adenine1518-N6/adenine1519-N6)-dimethyltransferase [Cryptosporangium aurantiacum]